ncbi:hypothetical protein FJZ28_03700 [Candidatus Peregrinibacteria bacterium]|nr:hypothetical protein [Candidatus Peregrinibacteria bacterium]
MRMAFFHNRQNEESERRLLAFGGPEAPDVQEAQPEEKHDGKEKQETIDPENVEQELQQDINKAEKEVHTNWKKIAEHYKKAVDSVRAVAEEFPDKPEQQELLQRMEQTLKTLEQRAAGQEQPNKPEQEQTTDKKAEQSPQEKAFANIAEKLGVKPEQLAKLKDSVSKLTPEDLNYMEKLAVDYGQQPADKRNGWLAQRLKTAPENVQNLLKAAQEIQAKPGEKANKGNEKKNDLKEFMKKFGELIEMIMDLLAECGLIARREKKEKSEQQTDKAGDDALVTDTKTFIKSSTENPGNPADTKQKLEGFDKQADKHIADAKTDVKEAEDRKKQINTDLQKAKDDKKALDEKPDRTEEENKRLSDLTESIKKLEANLVEAEKAVREGNTRVAEMTKLKADIAAAIAALPKEAPKAEEKPPAGEKSPERSGEGPPAGWKVQGNTEQVNTWLKEQADIHNQNLTTLPLSDSMRTAIETSGVTVISNKKGAVTTIQIGKEAWDVGLNNGDPVIRLSSDHSVTARIPDDVKLNADTLKLYAAKAMEYRKSESADAAGMGKGFEPAKNEPMGYIELSDLSDRLTSEIAQENREFSKLLSERYNLYKTPEGTIDGSVKNPANALREQIGTLMKNGIKNIYININAHGSESGMGFGPNELRAEQLTAIFKEFPDCKFTVNNIACHGGGLAEEMQKFKDTGGESGRVTVFTQTKEEVVNLARSTADEQTTSTAYNAALAKYLAQGVNGRPGRRLSYGEAHLYADKDAKKAQVTDAEVHQTRGDNPTARTANIGDPSKFEGMV